MLVDVRIPGYEIEGELGHGGSSVVYRGRRGDLPCAIKVPRKKGRWTRWVYREAVSLARVHHSGLPAIYDVGEVSGLPYLAMELVEGETLAERIRRGPLDEPAVLRLVDDLANILEAVHTRGLVHRDVKPRNVVLGRQSKVRLIDFGFAMPNERASTSDLAGTPAYAAPEQFEPTGHVDARTDLYCLGVVAWECLTADEPERARTAATQNNVEISLLARGASKGVASLIAGLVATAPEARYPSATAIRSEIELIRGGQPNLGPAGYRKKRVPAPVVVHANELEAVIDPWRSVRKSGALVIVKGQRGGGKSWLLDAFADAVDVSGDSIIQVRCDERDPPLALLRQVLEQSVTIVERLPAKRRATIEPALRRVFEPFAGLIQLVAPKLGPWLTGPTVMPQPDEAIGDAAADLIVRIGRAMEGVVIVVDDCQHVDLASRDAITRLSYRLEEVPILLVCAVRSAEALVLEPLADGARSATHIVELPELGLPEVQELVKSHLGQPAVDPQLVERVAALADGTPLGVLEVLGGYLDDGSLRPKARGWEFDLAKADNNALPKGALVLLGRRLRELPEATREVLTIAAVMGASFSDGLLARAVGLELSDVEFALRSARRAGLLTEESTRRHRFVHDSLREMLLTTLFPEARSDVHFTVAKAIEALEDDSPEGIFAAAFHYAAAGPNRDPQRAYRAARRAAEAATERFDHRTALRLLRNARSAAVVGGITLDTVFFRAEAETFLRIGALEESLKAFESALQGTTERVAAAELHARIAWVHQTAANPALSWSALERAFDRIDARMPVESVGSATRTFASFVRGEARKRIGARDRKRPSAENELLSALHYQNARLGLEYGKPFRLVQSALEAYELTSEVMSPRAQARGHGLYGAVLTLLGRREAGESELELAHRIAMESGDPVTVAFALQLGSVAACFGGEFDRALQLIAVVLDDHGVWCEIGEYCFNAANADLIESIRGRCAECWPWTSRGLERLRRSPVRRAVGSDWLLQRARASHAAIGQTNDDPWLKTRFEEVAREQPAEGITRMLSWGPRARYCVEGGKLDELDAVMRAYKKENYDPKAHPSLSEYFVAVGQGALHRALADGGKPESVKRLAAAAKDLASARLFPLLESHLLLFRGAVEWFEGNARKARAHLGEAESLATEHTCPWVLYGVSALRAVMLRKEGRVAAARDQARAAELFAREHGAAFRARWIREEFGLPAPPSVGHVHSLHSSSRARRQLSTLLHVARAPRPELRTEQQASTVLDEILRHLDAARGVVWFLPEPGRRPPVVVGRTSAGGTWSDLDAAHQALIQRVREEGVPWPPEPHDGSAHSIEGADPSRMLAVPLLLYERVAGAIVVERAPTAPAFATEERGILTVLSHQVPAALEIARLLVEREQVQATLQHAQKMEAVGQMAGGLAHDFNNMLQAMRGSIDELRARQTGGDATHDLEVLSAAAGRATLITQQLLSFSRHQPVAITPIDVNGAVSTLEIMIRHIVGEKVTVVLDLAAEGAVAETERSALDQAIMNVVVNARDAMPSGGTISIRTRNVELGEEAVRWGVPSSGPYVEIVVKDTGRGMPPEVLERIFEPFFTTKPVGVGTGLGMATVYAFAKRCRGHIEVASEEGNGTTVRLLLRKGVLVTKSGSEPPASTTSTTTAATEPLGSTILVVDDDELILKALGRMLERSGYSVLTAGGGEEALRLLRTRGREIGLVIMDVLMPGMSGPELSGRIADLDLSVKVLFMSGFAPESLPPQASGVNAESLLQKPFSPAALIGRVQTLLER